MDRPSLPIRAQVWCRRSFALAAFVFLAGCTNGDFGEVHPTLVRDDIHDWVALDAIAGKPGFPSRFELTDDVRHGVPAERSAGEGVAEEPGEGENFRTSRVAEDVGRSLGPGGGDDRDRGVDLS